MRNTRIERNYVWTERLSEKDTERGRSRREERDIRDEQRRRGTEKTASALFSG